MRWEHLVITSVLVFAASTAAAQYVPPVGPTVETCGGGPCRSAPAARPAARPAAPSAPSPAQLAQQQRQQAANQNALGNDCYTKGDWDCAIRYYQTALQYLPNDTVIQENLIRAQAAAQAARAAADQAAAQAEQQRRDAAAAEEIRQSMNRLTTTLNQDRAELGPADGGGARCAFAQPGVHACRAGRPENWRDGRNVRRAGCNLKPKAAVSADEPLTFMRDAPNSGSSSHRALDEANSTLYTTDHKEVSIRGRLPPRRSIWVMSRQTSARHPRSGRLCRTFPSVRPTNSSAP